MKSIFRYTDYRKYLKELFPEIKKEKPYFSHRYLCRKLGLKSNNFMVLVIQGKRNLSQKMSITLSETLHHSDSEMEYFSSMVEYAQAQDSTQKERWFGKMMEIRRNESSLTIEDHQYEYYSNWYNAPIGELAPIMGYPLDYNKLSKALIPPITVAEAKRSIQLLLELGILEDTGSSFVLKHSWFSSKRNRMSDSLRMSILTFLRKMCRMGPGSWRRFSAREYDFSNVIVTVSDEAYKKVVRELHKCMEKIATIEELDQEKDRVYNINLHVFPLSNKIDVDRNN